MSEHTPGKLSLIGKQGTSMWSGDSIVAQINEPRSNAKLARANARRLVAAWNACEGFETDLLENIVMTGGTLKSRFALRTQEERESKAESDSLRAVNAELVEALVVITNQLERVGDTRPHKDGQFIDDARAAIASARKQGDPHG